MRDSAGFRLSSALLLLASMAGCASAETPITGPVRQSLAEPAATPAPSTTYGFLDGVGLTAQQQAAIKAIAERRPASALSDARTRAERFRALMAAPTLDQAALADFFREGLQAEATGRTSLVASYVDVRAVLTAAQRVAAADAVLAQLNRPQTPPSSPPGQPGQNGQGQAPQQQMEPLTEQQAALFAATVVPPPDPRVVLQGIATLMRTGERGALEKAIAAKVGIGAQVAALVKAFASLSPTQRKQMVGG